jgi:hypothetical protein
MHHYRKLSFVDRKTKARENDCRFWGQKKIPSEVRAVAKLILRHSFLILLGIVAAVGLAVAQSESDTTPKITSVSKITTKQFQTITIKGKGFGTHAPYTGDSDYIALNDLTKKWQAGYSKYNDTVTLIVHHWDNTKIILGGFSGAWGTHNYTLGVGNKEKVQIWNAQTGAGPASKTVKVSKAATEISLASSLNPSAYGEPVTLTAVVSADTDAPPDGETVSFVEGTTVLGTATLRGGSASFTTSTLEPGANSIKAVYGGDSDFAGSASIDGDSVPLTQTVN